MKLLYPALDVDTPVLRLKVVGYPPPLVFVTNKFDVFSLANKLITVKAGAVVRPKTLLDPVSFAVIKVAEIVPSGAAIALSVLV